MRSYFFLVLLLLSGLSVSLHAQMPVTLEGIFKEYAFSIRSVSGFYFLRDGLHYARLEKGQIVRYNLLTGEKAEVLFDAGAQAGKNGFNGKMNGYSFSSDEKKILIESEAESIYRHSTRANFFVWDGKSLQAVSPDAKQRYATFSPNADKVAFVSDNDLYIKDLSSGALTRVTSDGELNKIINGATDWVYEEEFSFARAFQWSPDGNSIAYYRFDERAVPEFTMTQHTGDLYPSYVTFKYPKVGEANAVVSVHIYDLNTKKTATADLGQNQDIYVPRILWTQDPNSLCIFRMNRHQNHLELLLADARTGKTSLLLEEKSQWYIDIHDNLTFLKDGKHFLWTSEADGWYHIYLYDMKGKMVRQLTKGEWEVTAFYGVDEKAEEVFFQSTDGDPLRRSVRAVSLDGKKNRVLRQKGGMHSARFNSTFDYFIDNFSTINTAPVYTLTDRKGKEIRVLEDNAGIRDLQQAYGVQPVEFFTLTTSEEVTLNGYLIKPAGFDENTEYPLFMYLYGGPGSQQVTDSWKGQNYWWFQMLAQQGYMIACIDNRGTGGRGEAFKKMTYLQLGHYETIDQIEAARKLGALPYIDENRIGIFGWSYGGYMSSLCLLKGNDVFKAAIAVAPVTHWKWYDTIYTERFMRTLTENPEGYAANSPVLFADRLKGNYLLLHGTSDDNVHFQNAVEMSNALIEANKQFDTYFYPNRNHGIGGGNARFHLYTKMTQFLNEKLKGNP